MGHSMTGSLRLDATQMADPRQGETILLGESAEPQKIPVCKAGDVRSQP